jgi:hypothetical protein
MGTRPRTVSKRNKLEVGHSQPIPNVLPPDDILDIIRKNIFSKSAYN